MFLSGLSLDTLLYTDSNSDQEEDTCISIKSEDSQGEEDEDEVDTRVLCIQLFESWNGNEPVNEADVRVMEVQCVKTPHMEQFDMIVVTEKKAQYLPGIIKFVYNYMYLTYIYDVEVISKTCTHPFKRSLV